ncbi:hypothetical protein ACQPXM_03915 [Kribbella sp. CA-253562]|uniref:hypothetical protein n=1 Tax=Kribbella sp. CA-253562 TaxID=3239942 RepID=UPI003D8CAC69
MFEPASRSADAATIEKCFEALKQMLACPDANVRDAAGIRVTPWLLNPACTDVVRRFARPVTLMDLRRAAGP